MSQSKSAGNNANPQKENKMGVMPIKKLIVSMSVPMMISMLVQALYNVVDSVFVSMINQDALTAVTLAFPMQNLLISVAAGTGVGINSLLSRSLGEKRFDRSDAASNNGIFLIIINYIIFLIIGLFLTRPFIASQTDNPSIMQYGIDYLSIICILSIGLFCQVTFERLLQSTGLTLYSMISQATGAIINIIFDPIMIFGLAGFPKMGVKGAALATILGQVTASIIGLILNLKKNKEINISLKQIFKPSLSIIFEIYAVGLPSILMMAIGSIMTYLMNKILGLFEDIADTAIAVFGVYFKLQSFFFMPVFGLNNGLIPVLAFNFGAKNKERIISALKFALVLALCIMASGTVIFQVFPEVLLKMFNANEKMIELGIPTLRTISISFPIAAVCIVMGSVFQAFAESLNSLIVSIGRQLLVLIPAAYLLSLTNNIHLVWWAFPIAEISSLFLSSFLFIRLYRKLIKPMDDNSQLGL